MNNRPTFTRDGFAGLMEVLDACKNGRFAHMGEGYFILDRRGNEVVISFDGTTRRPASWPNQQYSTNMSMYYSICNVLRGAAQNPCHDSMYSKFHTDKWIADAANKGRILHTNGLYTVIFDGNSVLWIYCEGTVGRSKNEYAARNGYVLVEVMDIHASWSYLKANGYDSMAAELETFTW